MPASDDDVPGLFLRVEDGGQNLPFRPELAFRVLNPGQSGPHPDLNPTKSPEPIEEILIVSVPHARTKQINHMFSSFVDIAKKF